nr:MAG TPA: hypothetical protein [Caudoviricetes sp.]
MTLLIINNRKSYGTEKENDIRGNGLPYAGEHLQAPQPGQRRHVCQSVGLPGV